jgi:hypothetical protein
LRELWIVEYEAGDKVVMWAICPTWEQAEAAKHRARFEGKRGTRIVRYLREGARADHIAGGHRPRELQALTSRRPA